MRCPWIHPISPPDFSGVSGLVRLASVFRRKQPSRENITYNHYPVRGALGVRVGSSPASWSSASPNPARSSPLSTGGLSAQQEVVEWLDGHLSIGDQDQASAVANAFIRREVRASRCDRVASHLLGFHCTMAETKPFFPWGLSHSRDLEEFQGTDSRERLRGAFEGHSSNRGTRIRFANEIKRC